MRGARLLTATGFYLLLVCTCVRAVKHERKNETQLVEDWAKSIGAEIWNLAKDVIKPDQLKVAYGRLDAIVAPKSGESIINTISENVGRMLSRKMDAVKCLYKVAERISEQWEKPPDTNLTYYSAKYSNSTKFGDGENVTIANIPSNMLENATDIYLPMQLRADKHFSNVAVNADYSSVHIPTNVYDRSETVADTILWSKGMDNIFTHNYRKDPALMWQYLCSTTGMLRQYPAMKWPVGLKKDGEELPDIYDCRVRSWFIEASTCSKDMIILVDNSGSMHGMSNTIAKATVSTILKTLSNNDFVAVFNFSETTDQIIPCFKGKMVQATPENLRQFNNEVATMATEGVANLTAAFIEAFTMLENYRNESRCGPELACNQMIMLVTDGIASNITEIFEQYNWLDNGTIPVRVFTYLIGKEVTKVREIQWMACLNRGYYAHIHTQAEVPEQVLKYINVVARPLVLQGEVHPVVWTHAYVDISDELTLDKEKAKASEISWRDRLLTSVSIPVFDRRKNKKSKKHTADLLGVVGTDIPLKDIRKLTLPYKLGVNGYAFIVSNNGYVVLHPALKPDYNGELKLNYNSIDLTEVEILDDGRGPREPGGVVTDIRNALVNHECGSMTDVRVKLHYDDYRRVTLESRDYYYAALPLTPFGIAVVVPRYGKYYVKPTKEMEDYDHPNISDFFVGDNWGVHSEWVYCRYRYPEGHEFATPEDELRHFLKIVGNYSMSKAERFPEQYKPYGNGSSNAQKSDGPNPGKCNLEALAELEEDTYQPDCGNSENYEEYDYIAAHHEDHYCNRELMELLIMDALATNASFAGDFYHRDLAGQRIYRFNVFLRFMSTQSGLTRWQAIEGCTEGCKTKYKEENLEKFRCNERCKETLFDRIDDFKKQKRALDEPWYKGAILQHEIDPESVSVTVPPITERQSGINATVTISIGIFLNMTKGRDTEYKAAAGVAGLQLPMSALHDQFMEIVTNTTTIPSMNCRSSVVDCYLIDQNGYIVISEAKREDAGKFFGILDQTAPIMKSLVDQGLFNTVVVYDYLAICYDIRLESAADYIKSPFIYAWNLLVWLFARMTIFASQLYDLPMVVSQEEDEVDFNKPPKMKKNSFSRPCDKEMHLYIVNRTHFDKTFTNEPNSCALPFFARRVPHTNLLLVIVRTDRSSCYGKLDVAPFEIFPYKIDENVTTWPCHKIPLNDLYRRRLKHCFTCHEDEDQIEACGDAASRGASLLLLLALLLTNLLDPARVLARRHS